MYQQFNSAGINVCALDITGCVSFGLREFYDALKKKKISVTNVNHWTQVKNPAPLLIIGTTKNRRVQMLLENAGIDYLKFGPESIFLKWCEIPGGKALLIGGTDEAGLMYNLLEMARRAEKDGINALNKAEDISESPFNKIRCVDRYIVGHLDDEWFKSEEFWHYLLGRMAKARFNRFCLIVGFDTSYMSPPYSFFVETPKFPQVTVNGLDKKGKEANLSALRRLGALCHEYGMKFVFATWQQLHHASTPLVLNLPEDIKELSDYCYEGMKALLKAVPEIDIVHFRVNHESGVGTQVSAEDFFNRCADAVADTADETGRPLILDLRAKGLTDSMIAHALSRGLHVEVPTKHWCEHAGLPYHLSVMRTEELDRLDNFNHSRRYSYADMLRKPRFYDMIFRLWNYGSTNLFLWGDADYARRFSISCGLCGSAGFQINTPLALKYGPEVAQKEAWKTFVKKELRYGKWEDERFWMWYTAFGRLGYNPETDPSVWKDEFSVHFGTAGEALEKALAAASKIVPFVTTYHMPLHPSMAYWTEICTGFALFNENNFNTRKGRDVEKEITYGSTEPSDHGLFYGINEYVQDFTAGKLTGKYSPFQCARWLDEMAAETERYLSVANGKAEENAEYLAMKVDLTMLCDFARYHAAKIRASCALAFWKARKQKAYLSDTMLLLDTAIKYWEALSLKGRENYYHDLYFSTGTSQFRRGTWGDRTKELLADKETLSGLLKANKVESGSKLTNSYEPAALPVENHWMTAAFPDTAKAGEPLEIFAAVSGFGEMETQPVLHYRHTDQTEGLFRTLKMKRSANGYTAVVPAKYVTPNWDLQVYITIQGADGSCAMYPGIYHPVYPYPYHVITVK